MQEENEKFLFFPQIIQKMTTNGNPLVVIRAKINYFLAPFFSMAFIQRTQMGPDRNREE